VEHVSDADAWLYVRGEQSIRITRTPSGTGLVSYGPRRAEKHYEFASAAALDEFFDSYRQRLLRQGWTLAIMADRRQTEQEVSPEHERRSQRRRAKPPRQDE
jgi:hypothetical protein